MLATVCSWIEQFSFNTHPDHLVDNAVLAYRTVDSISKEADSLGINSITFDNRVLELNDSHVVLKRFFSQLGVLPKGEAFSDWTQLPKMGTPESNIFFADEPELYMSRNFHKKVTESSGLRYFPKEMSRIVANLSKEQVQKLIDNGIFEIYDRLRSRSVRSLGLEIPKSTELERYSEEANSQ
ncbi:hypothetical protein KKF86_08520 [bacterium]|nr:hypothetical protein [bacterium]